MSSRDIRTSKTLSWVLRHGAKEVNLAMNDGGFVFVDDLLKLPQFFNTTIADIERIVANNNKQRFAMEKDLNGRSMIRANQGHTITVENLDLTPITGPDECPQAVHGTYQRDWESIKQKGLSRMARQHVHMAVGTPNNRDVISGMRSDCDLLIYINVKQAMEDGLKFYRSANNVILCPGNKDGVIESKYFANVTHR